jgi:hypothetical protein
MTGWWETLGSYTIAMAVALVFTLIVAACQGGT